MIPAGEFHGVSKTFRTWRRPDVAALVRVDLKLFPGEVVALIGPNGGGKTTALRCLAGLVRPDEGFCTIAGRPSLDPESRHEAAFVAANLRAPTSHTPRRALELEGRLRGLRGSRLAEAVGEASGAVGLDAVLDVAIHRLSTGMARRVALARALVSRPRLLLLEETTSGIDPTLRAEILRLVRSRADDGVAVAISTHDLASIAEICEVAAFVKGGRVVGVSRQATGLHSRESLLRWYDTLDEQVSR